MIAGRLDSFDFSVLGPNFKRAAELIRKLSAETPVGKTVVDDDLYVNVMQYNADVPFGPCDYEAHKQFVDIQIILSGAECAVWTPVAGLPVSKPYNPEKDVMFYDGKTAESSRIELRPGMFVLFYPEDGHNGKFAPLCGAAQNILKAVVKVRI